MKKIILSSVLLSVLIFTSCKTTTELEKSYPAPSSSIDAVEFNEVWGYVMNKREKALYASRKQIKKIIQCSIWTVKSYVSYNSVFKMYR